MTHFLDYPKKKIEGQKVKEVIVDNLSTWTESITLILEDGTRLTFHTLNAEVYESGKDSRRTS